jgi:hypothetical protein
MAEQLARMHERSMHAPPEERGPPATATSATSMLHGVHAGTAHRFVPYPSQQVHVREIKPQSETSPCRPVRSFNDGLSIDLQAYSTHARNAKACNGQVLVTHTNGAIDRPRDTLSPSQKTCSQFSLKSACEQRGPDQLISAAA